MYLWLREHVEVPRAHLPISGDRDEIVSILTSHHIQAVDWVGMGGAGERRALDGRSLTTACVP